VSETFHGRQSLNSVIPNLSITRPKLTKLNNLSAWTIVAL